MADLLTVSEGLWAAGCEERNIQMGDILQKKKSRWGKRKCQDLVFLFVGQMFQEGKVYSA